MAKTSEMDGKKAAEAMRTIANDGYLAYIEWPVFLAHRLKQVEQHLSVTAAPAPEPSPETAPIASLPKQPPALRGKTKVPVAAPGPTGTVGVQPQAAAAVHAAQPIPQAVPATAAVGSAEGDLLNFLDNFDMQGEG